MPDIQWMSNRSRYEPIFGSHPGAHSGSNPQFPQTGFPCRGPKCQPGSSTTANRMDKRRSLNFPHALFRFFHPPEVRVETSTYIIASRAMVTGGNGPGRR